MFKKMFIGLLALGLVALSGSKVAAQDLIEYALLATLVTVGGVSGSEPVESFNNYSSPEQEAMEAIYAALENKAIDGCQRYADLVALGEAHNTPLQFLTCKEGSAGGQLCPCSSTLVLTDPDGNVIKSTTVENPNSPLP